MTNCNKEEIAHWEGIQEDKGHTARRQEIIDDLKAQKKALKHL